MAFFLVSCSSRSQGDSLTPPCPPSRMGHPSRISAGTPLMSNAWPSVGTRGSCSCAPQPFGPAEPCHRAAPHHDSLFSSSFLPSLVQLVKIPRFGCGGLSQLGCRSSCWSQKWF